ncbi:ROK family protein, partial [Streptomyces sp. BE147]|nr:ROK family protein [Streptomyces sp. BE147]
NLAALAELWFGGLDKVRSFLYLTGEIGVGGALVIDGELLRGAHGFATCWLTAARYTAAVAESLCVAAWDPTGEGPDASPSVRDSSRMARVERMTVAEP